MVNNNNNTILKIIKNKSKQSIHSNLNQNPLYKRVNLKNHNTPLLTNHNHNK